MIRKNWRTNNNNPSPRQATLTQMERRRNELHPHNPTTIPAARTHNEAEATNALMGMQFVTNTTRPDLSQLTQPTVPYHCTPPAQQPDEQSQELTLLCTPPEESQARTEAQGYSDVPDMEVQQYTDVPLWIKSQSQYQAWWEQQKNEYVIKQWQNEFNPTQDSLEQVQNYATNWLWFYNHERAHKANGGRPPLMAA